jgi:hypothetical protein
MRRLQTESGDEMRMVQIRAATKIVQVRNGDENGQGEDEKGSGQERG